MAFKEIPTSCIVFALAVVISGLVGCDSDSNDQTPVTKVSVKDEDEMLAARRLVSAEKWQQAGDVAIKVLLRDPDNAEAALIAAESALRQGNAERAVELAASIDDQSPLAESAIDIHARSLFMVGKVSEAADVLLAGIKKRPGEWVWHHRAWALLTRIGRREEASLVADQLCLAGEATEMELNSLIRRTESFPTQLESDSEIEAYFEPGLGIARWYFTQLEFRKSLQELELAMENGLKSPAAVALHGRLLAETQAHDRFPSWHAGCDPKEVQRLGDYWAALGTYFFDRRQFEASARALLNAVYQNPTDRSSMQRLAKVFDALGKPDQAQQYRVRGIDLAQCENTSNRLQQRKLPFTEHRELQQRIMQQLLEMERPFEVLGWAGLIHSTSSNAKQREIALKRAEILRTEGAVKLARESALLGEKLENYKLGDAYQRLLNDKSAGSSTQKVVDVVPLAKPHLVDVAAKVGLDFQWYRSLELDESPIPIHESIGGAIAVLDYDLDGWPDLYFAQGSGDPPSANCTRSNVLVRNVAGRFTDQTALANAEDFNYGSGLAAGDVNQDGFIDLYVGSLGNNRLLINNGDGTFRDATETLGENSPQFTSSLAIADINGDRLPDLFECDYIEMDGAFALPKIGPDGRPSQPSPLEHYAQSDRWFVNRGNGSFQLQKIERDVAVPGTSLGVVVTDFDGQPGNEVFVGNDVRPNHLLMHLGDEKLGNAADAKGVANGFEGAANGCMGIASGDYNRDGTIDLHITNFNEESANLYLQSPDGGFTDYATRYELKGPSFPMVGFGTKAIDIDRDGWLDLAVTNGHIFDMTPYDEMYKMPPQLFMNLGTRFELTNVQDESDYWSGDYLGRSMAKLDFDRDGDFDLIINHLDRPVALLENQTETQGNAIQLELCGTRSERDAIGAKVSVRSGETVWSEWVTAGDGYLCSDEATMEFGTGAANTIDSIEVKWPSGSTQTFPGPIEPKRYLLIEGEQELLQR